uniref:TPR_REGION domain-containing protein n=2 Tax=Caenorhabditis japonica TaxID=281687 RepID=A0A8R1EG75_CAEJA
MCRARSDLEYNKDMIFILVLVGGAADDPVLERCDRSVMINIDIVGRYDVERKGGIPCRPTGSNGVPDIGIPNRISYNLGVLHDLMNLRCSSLHYMKLCTDLKSNNPKAVGAMAVILSHMGDNKNAKLAYRKSIELKPVPSVVLNYAIFEYRQKDFSSSWKALSIYKELQSAGVKCTAVCFETCYAQPR